MCLYSIATEYNGTLEAAHAQIDRESDEKGKSVDPGGRRLVNKDQRRVCRIAPTNNYRMGSANVLV